jgi:hypothetical protein
VGSIADSDNFGKDPDPTFENNPDLEPTPDKNADPDPAVCKILYKLFVTRNFSLTNKQTNILLKYSFMN